MKHLLLNIFLFAFLFSGCDSLKPTFKAGPQPNFYTEQELKIAETLKDVPLEDCEKLYKIQIGFVNYLKNSNKPIKLEDVLGSGDSDEDLKNAIFYKLYAEYKYVPGKYDDYADAVYDIVKKYDSYGYSIVEKVENKEKEIAEEQVISDFTTLTNGIKSAIETKMAEK